MTKAIERICTVSSADIRARLYALVDVSVDNLTNGTIIAWANWAACGPA